MMKFFKTPIFKSPKLVGLEMDSVWVDPRIISKLKLSKEEVIQIAEQHLRELLQEDFPKATIIRIAYIGIIVIYYCCFGNYREAWISLEEFRPYFLEKIEEVST